MAVTVNMPQLGESVTEGTIARWLKQPGETVAKYESLAEVVTDKVNAEIPAPVDGTMGEIVAQEGAVVAVGEPICTIETTASAPGEPVTAPAQPAAAARPDAEAGAAPQAPAQGVQASPTPSPEQAQPAAVAPPPQPESQPAPEQPEPAVASSPQQVAARQETETAIPESGGANGGGSSQGYHLTPAVRMLVREHDVDLGTIQGSGLGGRITKKDVLEHVQTRDAGERTTATAATAGPPPAATQPAAAPPAPSPPQQAPPSQVAGPAPGPAPSAVPAASEVGDTLVPLTPIRRAIAEHMVRSRQTSPHAWMMMEVDMSAVSRLRTVRKEEFKRRYGVSLTFLPFVARATVEALRRHPSLNAQWSDQGIVLKHDVHLGIAVALEDNLIVPVVRNADRLSIAGLAQTMADLGERARANRLKLDEIQGGTFTLNNTGALGTVMTQAIINQPQAAILAMDAVIKRPVVVENDAIAIRPIMNIGLSFDHRLNDGLQATRFLKEVKDILESLDDSAALL